ELKRQVETLEAGDTVIQETRLYDTVSGQTRSMRSKEEAHDYRYFPEPDLPPLRVGSAWVERVRANLPELPESKKLRFIEQYGIPTYDAGVLTTSRAVADYFEATTAAAGNAKAASNWIMSESLRKMNETGVGLDVSPVGPEALGEMIRLIDDGTISGKIGKELFQKMYSNEERPRALIEKEGLTQITDRSAIEEVARTVLAENAKQVDQYRGGKTKVLGWLVGQVMKATRGKANPNLVGEVLKDLLK
ncbi:MAG: Asp-tRNA(Asn)/Glu-tRNA(Gln) amidotransferase GatCAB subunit B, partial [Vicinamibacteria bacterium]